jgi:thioredoxin 1
MAAPEVTDETFALEVLDSPVPVIVDFWAPWCRPCKAIEPVLDAIAADARDKVRLVRLDVDANLGVAGRYGVLSLPTVIVFAGGEPKATVVGAASRTTFEREFADWL